MSALDQALIKAYDKPTVRPPTAEAAPAQTAGRASDRAAAGASAAVIERIYHEGGLYRIDRGAAHVAGAQAASRGGQPALQGPHIEIPPPTSPKRGVRRSILRLLQNQPLPEIVETPTPPRVQRKVIIRHVAHGGPSRDRGLPSPHFPPATPTGVTASQAENASNPWSTDDLAAQSCLIIAPPAESFVNTGESLVQLQFDALPETAATEVWTAFESPLSSEQPAAGFSAKSLEDESESNIRADRAHGRGPRRPHLTYSGTKPEFVEAATPAEFAQEADSVNSAEVIAEEVSEPAVQPSPARASAVWEVDRFHWPRTCQKLLTDEAGYLSQVGDKLLAAVKDGLKTLAITGSRRGEGRSTLALCLARAAAQAGIQVAVMDADFARPAIASRLGLEIAHGWQAAALGDISLSEAAIKSLADNITVVPLETSQARHQLGLSDPRVTATLRAIAATFELVIIDLGPLAPGERMEFPPGEACPFDAAIVVRDLRFASTAESQTTGETLHQAGIEAVGIAENFVTDEELASA